MPRARSHLVEHHAKTEQIRAGIELFAQRLLRRHVSDGANSIAGVGEILLDYRFAWQGIAGVCVHDHLARQNPEPWRGRVWSERYFPA